MSSMTTSFFGIEKADRHADGTLTVYGKATDDSIDIDQQICDADWLKRAMPHWFSTGGNIREQHSNVAAGVAKEYEVKEDGHYITALVVDPVSVKKVENGVLKGFSIGIKNPRVTRDKSAANGRIIDGQIVEVSLVDRPANPNCQLVLAKSVGSDETVVQVEELRENSETLSENNLELEEILREENMKTAAELIEESKKFVGADTTKFDAKAYETARNALARLIQIEAKEMETEGHDEQMSLAHLLEAVRHLFAWYEGEEAEGEVVETEIIEEKGAHKDEIKPKKGEKRADFLKRCKDAGMSDDDAAKCWGKYTSAESEDEDEAKKASKKESDSDEEDDAKKKEADAKEDDEEDDAKKAKKKGAEISKCLECGCNVPGSDHGATTTNDFANVSKPSHVTTAEMYSPDQTPKSAQVSTEKVDIEAIVEQALKSATQTIKSDIAELLTAKEAAEEKANRLETELAEAKSLAVAGGPKRTAKPVSETSNDLLVKAAAYKAKAQATTDPTLAKGYEALAREFLGKASTESK